MKKRAKKTAKPAKKKTTIKKPANNVCCSVSEKCPSGGGAYFLGFLGAAIYYISSATGFWNGVLGVLKALVWPAFLIYELFKFLGM